MSGGGGPRRYVSTFSMQIKPPARSNQSNSATGVAVTQKEVIPKRRTSSGTVPLLQFENPAQNVTVKVGEAACLRCSFTGSPPVVSCWIRHKEQIVDGPEVWTENSALWSSLLVASAAPHHAGRYTCVVKDRRSSAQQTLTLSVIERPQPPPSCPLISQLPDGPLVLSWSGPCYDGGSAVLGYVVEVRVGGLAEPGGWSELVAQCRSTSLRVCPSQLQPQNLHSFRVRAFNTAGLSEPSAPSPPLSMEQQTVPENNVVTIDLYNHVTHHYHVLEKLGVGKFGQVFKLSHKETGEVCAGKFYRGRRAKEREAALGEIQLMKLLHHPKLVQCLAAYDSRMEVVMVMEYLAGEELFERIVDEAFEHTEAASARYMQQILEGVAHMHRQNIVHLDLKPENIVCVDATGTHVKIVDFGLARLLDPKVPLKVMHGTPEFVAPEVINYEPVTFATDMWSIGVICYILLSGDSPFQGHSDPETLALVTAAQWEFDDSFDEISSDAENFISSLLLKDTRRRMSCADALSHHWMATLGSEGSSSKSLSREKMKRFLARQKWKKAGKAMLALKRMTHLSRAESTTAPPSPGDSPLSPEAESALQALELEMQGPPRFSVGLVDQEAPEGSRARLCCRLTGYPDPEVVWLRGVEPLTESSRVQIEYEEDGRCTLVLQRVEAHDSAVYTCRASNAHGDALCSAKLSVEETGRVEQSVQQEVVFPLCD